MGVQRLKRQAADRSRTISVRRQGSASLGYPTFGVVFPVWLAVEITGSDDPAIMWERLREYEFLVEKTDEGVLYKPTRIKREEGW